MVLEARFFIIAFFEDVHNEITAFASSGCRNSFQIIAKPCGTSLKSAWNNSHFPHWFLGCVKAPCKCAWQIHAMALTWPLPPGRTVLGHFLSWSLKMRHVFAHFRKRLCWYLVLFLFLLFSFSLLRRSVRWSRPDSRGLRHCADP